MLDQVYRKRTPRQESLLSLAAAFVVAAAVVGRPAPAQLLNIHHYTGVEGLPLKAVTAFHQDAAGYLWLGTSGGASRFDGQTFRNYAIADGLASNMVFDFAEDTAGRLWLATLGGGICRRDGERFHCLELGGGPLVNNVASLAADPAGGLWAATEAGLARVTGDGEQVQLFDQSDGLPGPWCRTVAVDAFGTVWAGTGAGLARRVGSRFVAVEPEALGDQLIMTLLPTPGGLVIGTGRAAYLLANGELERLVLPTAVRDAGIFGAALGHDGRIWLATERGMAVALQGGRSTLLTVANGLPNSDPLGAVLVDREGNVWFGTSDGACRYVPGPIRVYTEAHGLAQNWVRAIGGDRRGQLWIATETRGITIYDGERFRPLPLPRGMTPYFRAIAALADGRMLAGTDEGLALFDGERLVRRYREQDGMASEFVHCLLADEHGAWVGTQRGLVRFEGERVSTMADASWAPTPVLSLARDRRGRLWVGMGHGGIAIYDGTRVERLHAANGLTDQAIWDIALHPDGAMWVATGGEGVFRIDDRGIRHFSKRNGLTDDTVWVVHCDRQGEVWMYGRGLDRLVGDRFRHYGPDDGPLSLEAGIGAVWENGAGDLWFGTRKGLVQFVRAAERRNATPPPLALAAFAGAGGGRLLHPGSHLTAGSGLLTFRFAALSYRNPGAVRYRYRIAGLDEGWSAPSAERKVTIARLPPGAYAFEVTGSNDDGVYAARPARHPFVVDPQVWQTTWFHATTALALAAALAALYRLRVRKLQSNRRRLERAIAERTAELELANQRLETLATTDPLTGLANRRHLQQSLDGQLRTLSRATNAQSLALVLLDIDHFKRVNDTYGHPAGDALLAALADQLRAQVRASDLVARYGGEEFAVVLPATERSGALVMAQKIHRAVRALGFETNGVRLPVTVSVGVSVVKLIGRDVDETAQLLLHEADEALYRAKREGRDRVVIGGPEWFPEIAIAS